MLTTLIASAETTLVVDVETLDDQSSIGAKPPRVLLPSIRLVRYHWSSDLPMGPLLSEPLQMLHVPGQLGAGNSYLMGIDRRGYPATPD